jgi:hypothetical protein
MEVSGQLHAPAVLPSEKRPPVPIIYKAGWTTEPDGSYGEEKILAPDRNLPNYSSPHYTAWASCNTLDLCVGGYRF